MSHSKWRLLLALTAVTALTLAVFLPLQVYLAPQPALRVASLPAEAATITLPPITNDTNQAANDLHVTLAGTGGSLRNARIVRDAPDCSRTPGQATAEGNMIVVTWGSPCVDPGESVVIEVQSDFEFVQIAAVVWTLNGTPIATPTSTPTATPTPTRTPTLTPTPTRMPTSGSEPGYNPEDWNYKPKKTFDSAFEQMNNNCYNYACNTPNDRFAQPGTGGGYTPTAITCAEYIKAAKADGLGDPVDCDKACPAGSYKKALVVAPRTDYHWYRQDSDGTWSHKPGQTEATNKDASGNTITDPRTADRNYPGLNYTDFCGCFCCNPSKVNKSGPGPIWP
jgi:hypothetical protein